MALTPVLTSSASPKQIVATGANTTVYTVPAGKTFTGSVWAASAGVMTINGVQIPGGYVNPFAYSVTLLGGTVVASNTGSSGNVTVFGVEQ